MTTRLVIKSVSKINADFAAQGSLGSSVCLSQACPFFLLTHGASSPLLKVFYYYTTMFFGLEDLGLRVLFHLLGQFDVCIFFCFFVL